MDTRVKPAYDTACLLAGCGAPVLGCHTR